MSKLFGKILKNSSVLALVAAPAMVFAAPSTDPISTFGILGSYNDFKLEGGSESDKDHMPEAGLFYNFGNKLTAESGFIYRPAWTPSLARKATTNSRKARPTSTWAGAPRWMRATLSMCWSAVATAGPVMSRTLATTT